MKTNKGFSLVELIVVIAIMAIIAAVAVPVYNTYIDKAERAADEQLLSIINEAFNSACIANNTNPYDLTTAYAVLNADGSVNDVYVTASGDAYSVAFHEYFEVTGDAKFKVIKMLVFSNGKFVESVYGSLLDVLKAEDITNLKNSSFGEIGLENLLGKVDEATLYALAADPNSSLGQLIASQEEFLIEKIGEDAYFEAILARAQLLASKDGEDLNDLETSDPDLYNEYMENAMKDVNANSAILNAATNSSAAITDTFIDDIKAGNAKDAIKDNASDAGTTMSQIAFAYGMYTSYCAANNIPVEGDLDHNEVLDTLASEEFKTYMTTEQAEKDMEGYMSAMNMVNDSSSANSDAVTSILVNGMSDPDLLAMLQQATK